MTGPLLAVQFLNRNISFLNADTLEIVWQTEPLFAPELKKRWWFGWRAVALKYHEVAPDTRPYPPGCAYVGARLFEDEGGRIWGIASSDWGRRTNQDILGTSAGVISFNVAAKKQTFHSIEFSAWGAKGLMDPSPNGRLAVRRSPQWELGPTFDADHASAKLVWMIEHQSLDLWSVTDQKPVTRLRVSDMPVNKYISRPGNNPEVHLQRLADWSCKAKDRFRMPLGKPPGIEKLNVGSDALRDLRDLGKNQRLEVHWEEDSEAVWVATR